ncbi:hypothetical protein [Rugamonas aquatica]|uniref:EfeO-type cupredoxin-like domain-containing protein n=1 Tax=Rugamonas aquatica TaxID=2743357 RepID=A0A6A7MVN9_9BURK|nr:hypothetical protein [Rugamonas aquatica]MQA37015.1 hypothetical protein [Rugamonas aquatica]
MKKRLLLLLIVCAFVACSRSSSDGVTFIVKNVSTEPLRSMVVHVTGNSYAIGDIEAGASKSVVLHPTSDSHVELAFTDHPRLKVDCYLEYGYGGTLATEITVDRVVAVKDSTIRR